MSSFSYTFHPISFVIHMGFFCVFISKNVVLLQIAVKNVLKFGHDFSLFDPIFRPNLHTKSIRSKSEISYSIRAGFFSRSYFVYSSIVQSSQNALNYSTNFTVLYYYSFFLSYIVLICWVFFLFCHIVGVLCVDILTFSKTSKKKDNTRKSR